MSNTIAVPYAALPKIFALLAALAVVAAIIVVTPDREERVRQLLADGELGAALEVTQSSPAGASLSERGMADRIDLHLRLGHVSQALAIIDVVLAEKPNTPWALTRKDEIIDTIGSFDERVDWASEKFARTPGPDDFRFLLGAAQLDGDTEREAAIITRALALEFAQPRDLEQLGLIRASQGAHQEAIVLLEQVVTGQTRPSVRARLTLFALMTQTGRIDRAIEIALATGLDPKDPDSMMLYAAQSRGPTPERMQILIERTAQADSLDTINDGYGNR